MSKLAFCFAFLFTGTMSFAQTSTVPANFRADSSLSAVLHDIVADLGLDKDSDVGEDGIEQISLAVIDLNEATPALGGVNPISFIQHPCTRCMLQQKCSTKSRRGSTD